jgi:hypothetical protein
MKGLDPLEKEKKETVGLPPPRRRVGVLLRTDGTGTSRFRGSYLI